MIQRWTETLQLRITLEIKNSSPEPMLALRDGRGRLGRGEFLLSRPTGTASMVIPTENRWHGIEQQGQSTKDTGYTTLLIGRTGSRFLKVDHPRRCRSSIGGCLYTRSLSQRHSN